MGMCISLSLHSKLKKTLFAMLLLVLLTGNLRMYFGYLRANLTLGVPEATVFQCLTIAIIFSL